MNVVILLTETRTWRMIVTFTERFVLKFIFGNDSQEQVWIIIGWVMKDFEPLGDSLLNGRTCDKCFALD